jgi:hypothetical protein
MKQFLWAALLACPLLAAAERTALAWGCPDCSQGGGHSHFFPCLGVVPGPWYMYWPTGPGGAMAASQPYSGWRYPSHFQNPAPIGDSFCSDYGGFYPSYWYGR